MAFQQTKKPSRLRRLLISLTPVLENIVEDIIAREARRKHKMPPSDIPQDHASDQGAPQERRRRRRTKPEELPRWNDHYSQYPHHYVRDFCGFAIPSHLETLAQRPALQPAKRKNIWLFGFKDYIVDHTEYELDRQLRQGFPDLNSERVYPTARTNVSGSLLRSDKFYDHAQEMISHEVEKEIRKYLKNYQREHGFLPDHPEGVQRASQDGEEDYMASGGLGPEDVRSGQAERHNTNTGTGRTSETDASLTANGSLSAFANAARNPTGSEYEAPRTLPAPRLKSAEPSIRRVLGAFGSQRKKKQTQEPSQTHAGPRLKSAEPSISRVLEPLRRKSTTASANDSGHRQPQSGPSLKPAEPSINRVLEPLRKKSTTVSSGDSGHRLSQSGPSLKPAETSIGRVFGSLRRKRSTRSERSDKQGHRERSKSRSSVAERLSQTRSDESDSGVNDNSRQRAVSVKSARRVSFAGTLKRALTSASSRRSKDSASTRAPSSNVDSRAESSEAKPKRTMSLRSILKSRPSNLQDTENEDVLRDDPIAAALRRTAEAALAAKKQKPDPKLQAQTSVTKAKAKAKAMNPPLDGLGISYEDMPEGTPPGPSPFSRPYDEHPPAIPPVRQAPSMPIVHEKPERMLQEFEDAPASRSATPIRRSPGRVAQAAAKLDAAAHAGDPTKSELPVRKPSVVGGRLGQTNQQNPASASAPAKKPIGSPLLDRIEAQRKAAAVADTAPPGPVIASRPGSAAAAVVAPVSPNRQERHAFLDRLEANKKAVAAQSSVVESTPPPAVPAKSANRMISTQAANKTGTSTTPFSSGFGNAARSGATNRSSFPPDRPSPVASSVYSQPSKRASKATSGKISPYVSDNEDAAEEEEVGKWTWPSSIPANPVGEAEKPGEETKDDQGKDDKEREEGEKNNEWKAALLDRGKKKKNKKGKK